MDEKYHKWEPKQGIENELWVEALHDDYEGLRVLLKGSAVSSGVLTISFTQYFAYRNVDESFRDKLWSEGNFEQRDWCLFKTDTSEFIEWLSNECGPAYNKKEMVHYLIKTGADVIEVVTNRTLPVVEWLNVSSDVNSLKGAIVKRGKRGIYIDK